jgi:hypothetical protein
MPPVTHLHHEVTMIAPPREWADAVLDAVVAEIESARFDDQRRLAEPALAAADVRLSAGPHLGPGSRYLVGPDGDEITVHEWHPQSRIAFTVADERPMASVTTDVEVVPGLRSRAVSVSGRFQVPGPFPTMRRLHWDAQVDLDRWWAGELAIEATVEHRWARATITARAHPGHGRWTVRGDARGRGRSWGRLMVGVALIIWRDALTRQFREGLDRAARGWDGVMARWQAAPPEEAARALLAALVTALVEAEPSGPSQ